MRRLVPLPGSKASLAGVQANYLPDEPVEVSWETNAGTLAFTNNVLAGLGLKRMYATEIETGMFNLLKVCKECPVELATALMQTEYSMEEFERAQEQEKQEYAGMTDLEIAVAKYILLRQSFNGLGTTYRDIDKGREDDIFCWRDAQRQRDKYMRQALQVIEYSQALQNVELIHGDMLEYFDTFAADPAMFVYSDIPYTNNLRSNKLYKVDTDRGWHERFAKKLAEMTRDGRLRAKMMLCNYVNENLQADLYCKELLKEGWTLYLIKDVFRPTVIKENSKTRKKNKAVEAVFLNYTPINPIVGKERVFTYSDVFGWK